VTARANELPATMYAARRCQHNLMFILCLHCVGRWIISSALVSGWHRITNTPNNVTITWDCKAEVAAAVTLQSSTMPRPGRNTYSDQKPPYSYIALTAMAIQSSPDKVGIAVSYGLECTYYTVRQTFSLYLINLKRFE